ncbi:LD-carboxypeptidase [Psychrobium sp. 1_MG-2023]|uniref:LD-carboxypeptidase n=1 Tax=Psychrobium sp. 1_MG-2023 TaxID=3062624 RepID=UPI0027332070|nr:LD-carboxypeptidase [Psychrobium sp. 1_MG-2023]MDP2562439.1 LD-carboxypeptidase [Psychrobium sp. 1_MG-2023]
MLYPSPLIAGSTIAITAFSSGVPSDCHPRLDIVIAGLKQRGFDVIEGSCLRENYQHLSADKITRSQELMTMLCDDNIDAIMPPWGGELAMDLLPLLDYERLALAKPKWLIGFSDISTLQVALTTKLGWASAHATNLMQLHPQETESLTTQLFDCLSCGQGQSFEQ